MALLRAWSAISYEYARRMAQREEELFDPNDFEVMKRPEVFVEFKGEQ